MRCVVGNENLDEKRDGPLVCFRCSNRILRHLRELEEYLPTLSPEKTVGGDSGRKSGFESSSPANDAVLIHQDPRSGWDELDGYGALAVLISWASLVVEERRNEWAKSKTSYGLPDSVLILRRNHSWIVQQPWVDEYAGELRSVHAAVRALAHDPVPRSQGKCIRWHGNVECKGDVFELDDASGVRCSRCKAIYTGLDLDRLRVAQEAS